MLESKVDYLLRKHAGRNVHKVRSFSRPDEYHFVWQRLDGMFDCSCEFKQIYRSKKCDHIRKAQHIKLKWHGRSVKKGKNGYNKKTSSRKSR